MNTTSPPRESVQRAASTASAAPGTPKRTQAAPRQADRQVAEHQHRRKGMPFTRDALRLDNKRHPGIEFLENIGLVGAQVGHQQSSHTDIDRQQYDESNNQCPEYGVESLVYRLLQKSARRLHFDQGRHWGAAIPSDLE